MSVRANFEIWVGVAEEKHVSAIAEKLEDLPADEAEALTAFDTGPLAQKVDSDENPIGYGRQLLWTSDEPVAVDLDDLSKQPVAATAEVKDALKTLGLKCPVRVWSGAWMG